VLCGGFGFFECIIFVSLLWFKFNKWSYASIDAEAGAVSFPKKDANKSVLSVISV
jgi:hypothetical protein